MSLRGRPVPRVPESIDPSYDALERLTRAGTKTYAYEDNGNQPSAGTRTFTYDLENRLLSTTQGGEAEEYGALLLRKGTRPWADVDREG